MSLFFFPAEPAPPGSHAADPDSGRTCEVDPDFLEHIRREELDQPDLPWDA